MKIILFLFTTILLTSNINSQNEPIIGRYGKNDMRIRAGNGSIEEGRLYKYDFSYTGLQNIAVIYWPDYEFGLQKIGITVFENSKKRNELSQNVVELNKRFLKNRLDSIREIKFSLVDTPENITEMFKKKPIVSKVKLLDESLVYLKYLISEGFDGLFIIYEDEFQDLMTGAKGWIPSKGLFKFYKKELVYYGLYSTLVDLNLNKVVKNIGYKQLSADYSQIPFKEIDSSIQPKQLEILNNDLIARFKNNINEILRIHKIDYR